MSSVSLAIDGDATSVDQLELRYRVYDDLDTAGVFVRGEIPLLFSEAWSLLANGGWSRILEDGVLRENMWHISLGPKYYLFENTSVAILAQADWTGTGEDFLAAGGGVLFEQRFKSVMSKVSPFVQLQVTYLDVGAAPWTVNADADFTSWVGNIVLGSDFLLSEDVFLVVKGEIWNSFQNSDDAFEDWAQGFAAGLGLKYYWR